MELSRSRRSLLLAFGSIFAVLLGGGSRLFGVCGPFNDLAADAFCPFVLEIFALGITTGTTATTYDPTSNVNRLQMAAFLSRTVDGALRKGSRRAALDRFWTSKNGNVLGITTLGAPAIFAHLPASDGADVWVPSLFGNTVSRVRASDGRLLETWTGATGAAAVLCAMGSVFATGETLSGALYRIDPRLPAGAVTTVASSLDRFPVGLTFDGARIWTANQGSVSIVTPGASIPWTVTTVGGFGTLYGAIFDGANVWVTDGDNNTIRKLDANGAALLTITIAMGAHPQYPVFDGANIWVPNYSANSVSVLRAASGAILATLTGNGLNLPYSLAFDGERVLATDYGGDRVSLWKAADLSPIGFFPTGSSSSPTGACSDGIQFWLTIQTNQLARF
jgi:DNA-binding beta-propeller fold protein YncE